ncbi:unnamed protein product [Haemonchus placei]|uniref:MATH domain-containing protein n=1 Tax=Haemonchus placei TaxID=6290 RepID=A0A158QMX1_HAEPC|nr:unnamed protein product [Haemonchus placei]
MNFYSMIDSRTTNQETGSCTQPAGTRPNIEKSVSWFQVKLFQNSSIHAWGRYVKFSGSPFSSSFSRDLKWIITIRLVHIIDREKASPVNKSENNFDVWKYIECVFIKADLKTSSTSFETICPCLTKLSVRSSLSLLAATPITSKYVEFRECNEDWKQLEQESKM